MSDRGYIYVLFNPLMTGLVKVGKTTRDPEERAAELSSSTGVPAPFIVAYQREVNDCTRAEDFVHSYLTNLGCRVNNNREFFRASLTTAIDAVLEYCKVENSSVRTFPMRTFGDESDDIFDDDPDDEKPLYEIEEELGDNYYYGYDDYIEDYEEALKHYKLAIKYGSTTAYRSVGRMYVWGDGVKENHSTALRYFKQGIEHGDYLSYANMIYIYLADGNKKNADKCFCKAMQLCSDDDKPYVCYEYIDTCLNYEIPVEQDKIELMLPYKIATLDWLVYNGDNELMKEKYRKRKKYVQEYILNDDAEVHMRLNEEKLGDKCLDSEDYEEALKHFNLAIRCGSFTACKKIGYMYSLGLGVEQNRDTAVSYYNEFFLKAMKVCNEEEKPEICFDYIDHCIDVDVHFKKQYIIEMMRPYKDEIAKKCSTEAYANWVRALFD